MNKTYERNDFTKIKKIIVIVLAIVIVSLICIKLAIHFYSVKQKEKIENDYKIETYEVVNIFEDKTKTAQGESKNYKIIVKYYDESYEMYQTESLNGYYTEAEANHYLSEGYIDVKVYNNQNVFQFFTFFMLDNFQFGFLEFFVLILFLIMMVFIVVMINDKKIRNVIEKGETIFAQYHDARCVKHQDGREYEILYTYVDSNGNTVIGSTHDSYTSYELDYFRHNKNLEIKKYKNISVIVRSKDPRYQNQSKIPEMFYCDYCGTHIEQGRKKCKYCGSSVKTKEN